MFVTPIETLHGLSTSLGYVFIPFIEICNLRFPFQQYLDVLHAVVSLLQLKINLCEHLSIVLVHLAHICNNFCISSMLVATIDTPPALSILPA